MAGASLLLDYTCFLNIYGSISNAFEFKEISYDFDYLVVWNGRDTKLLPLTHLYDLAVCGPSLNWCFDL